MTAGLADLWVHYQNGPTSKPDVIRLYDALRLSETTPYYALSLRAWSDRAAAEAKDGPARYLPVWDFDGRGATSDAEAFCIQQLEPWGLRRGRDYLVCVSSAGRRKVWLRWYLPALSGWTRVWEWWSIKMRAMYPSIDSNMAKVALARWVGSSHRNKGGWHQVPLHPGMGEGSAKKRPTPKQKRSWYPGLLDSMPPWARRIADDWCFDSIVTSTKNRRQNASRWRKVDYASELALLGIPMVTKQVHGETWVRLKDCPYCGKQWKAAVTSNGWLRCFSASCQAWGAGIAPASRSGGWAALLGLDPSKLRAMAHKPLIVRGSRRLTKPLPLGTVRNEVKKEVRAALDGSSTVVLRVTPGGGKSTATIREIHRRVRSRDNKRYLYLCPTKELAEEKLDELTALGSVKPMILQGRHSGNCAMISKVRAAATGGYPAGVAICPACPYQNGCEYYRELRKAQKAAVVISVWEHLHLVQAGRLNPHHIIIDEFPERALINDSYVSVPALHSWMGESKALAAAAELLARVALRADRTVKDKTGHAKPWRSEELRKLILSTNRKAAQVFRDAVLDAVEAIDISAGALAAMETKEIAQLPPLQVCKLILAIDGELRSAGTQATTTSLVWTPSGTHYQHTGVVELEVQSRLRLVLDGYGRQGVYERLLGCSVKVVEVDAEFLGRVWQVPVNTSRSAVNANPSKTLSLGKRVLGSLRAMGHSKILFITFQSFRQEVESWGVDVRHFGQGVGINTYRDTHSAVVVLGTPRRPHRALVSMAAALHRGEPAIDEQMAPHTNHLYADPRLQEILEISREDEIAQGVHRIGPVIPGPLTKDVVVIGCVEVGELPPPIVVKSTSLDIVDRIQAFSSKHGWWANALRDLVSPECLGLQAERAIRVYNEIVKVGVGQLVYRGPKNTRVGQSSHTMGFVWGDEIAAARWCADFAVHEAAGMEWTQENVRSLSRRLGIAR